jgi:hypothetical protein
MYNTVLVLHYIFCVPLVGALHLRTIVHIFEISCNCGKLTDPLLKCFNKKLYIFLYSSKLFEPV